MLTTVPDGGRVTDQRTITYPNANAAEEGVQAMYAQGWAVVGDVNFTDGPMGRPREQVVTFVKIDYSLSDHATVRLTAPWFTKSLLARLVADSDARYAEKGFQRAGEFHRVRRSMIPLETVYEATYKRVEPSDALPVP